MLAATVTHKARSKGEHLGNVSRLALADLTGISPCIARCRRDHWKVQNKIAGKINTSDQPPHPYANTNSLPSFKPLITSSGKGSFPSKADSARSARVHFVIS